MQPALQRTIQYLSYLPHFLVQAQCPDISIRSCRLQQLQQRMVCREGGANDACGWITHVALQLLQNCTDFHKGAGRSTIGLLGAVGVCYGCGFEVKLC